jgi:two-component system, response regulator
MPKEKQTNIILMAEDDEDDYLLARDAFKEHFPLSDLRWVQNGEELMDYLLKRGKYQNAPKPSIVLLDLNMPKKDGREALKEIKSHPLLKKIPIVALTGSNAEADVLYAYGLGVNSFIRKPVGFNEFVDFMKVCYEYDLDIVKLPNAARNSRSN